VLRALALLLSKFKYETSFQNNLDSDQHTLYDSKYQEVVIIPDENLRRLVMGKKYVTFGEIMLRLKSPAHERFFQSPALEATFGGGEANVAVSLSLFGKDAKFVTALPANAIGEAAVREVRKYGVDTSDIKMTKNGRVGIYFLETGANQRPSSVVYDRADSSIALSKPSDFDFPSILEDAQWLHVTGITPAISQNAADSALAAMVEAKKAGATVSVDLNYRKKLWNYGKTAVEVMRELVKFADVIIANEEDIQKCLGIEAKVDVTSGELDIEVYKELTKEVKLQFPNVSVVAVTLRESKSADHNGWSAALSGKSGFYLSKRYEITDIIDRVGGGDSFSAGLIYALSEYGDDEQYAINFAVAASALKHSIDGDFNLSTKAEVQALLKGDGSGRVQR
jgi:2-dehydro-3-deoxygluconokinase